MVLVLLLLLPLLLGNCLTGPLLRGSRRGADVVLAGEPLLLFVLRCLELKAPPAPLLLLSSDVLLRCAEPPTLLLLLVRLYCADAAFVALVGSETAAARANGLVVPTPVVLTSSGVFPASCADLVAAVPASDVLWTCAARMLAVCAAVLRCLEGLPADRGLCWDACACSAVARAEIASCMSDAALVASAGTSSC